MEHYEGFTTHYEVDVGDNCLEVETYNEEPSKLFLSIRNAYTGCDESINLPADAVENLIKVLQPLLPQLREAARAEANRFQHIR